MSKEEDINPTTEMFIKAQKEYDKSLRDPNYEAINHPSHYTQGVETTEYIESWGMDFVEGNIIKYVSRYKYKRGVQDLKKAQWYLKRLIQRVETVNKRG